MRSRLFLQVSVAKRGREAPGKQSVRDRPCFRLRPLVDEPERLRTTGRRAVRYPLTRLAFARRKAVGEACGFPYRLITNCPSLPLRPMGEAQGFLVAAVSELYAVAQWRLP